jgi:predicted porin
MGGVQLGVRYAASPSQGLSTKDIRLDCAVCTTGSGDWLAPLPGSLELGVNYAAGGEAVSLQLAGSYFAAEPERTAISLEAARSWGVGGKIDFKLGSAGALALGGSYSNRNYVSLTGASGRLAGILTDQTSAWAWDAGLSYAYGPWMLGGYYQTAEVDVASALASQITSLSPAQGGRAIGLQGGYRVAPGVALAAGVQFWDYQNSALNLSAAGQDRLKDSSSTVVFLETAVDF